MPDAIETDVSGQQHREGFKTKHDRAYEELIARRAAESSGVVVDDNVTPVDANNDTENDPEVAVDEIDSSENDTPEPVKTISFIDDDGNTIEVPVTAKYKAKIDGEEVDTPIENITRSYQKGAAADRRLEDATRKLKELGEKEADLTKREKEYLDKMDALEEKRDAGKLSDDAYRKTAQKLLNALTESETPEEDLVNVLREMGVPQTPKIDEDKIVAKALNKVEEKRIKEQEKEAEKRRLDANKRFDKEYKDILDDPVAYKACKAIANEKWNAGSDPWDAITEAAQEVREWKGKISPSKQVRREKPKSTPKTVASVAKVGEDKKPQTRTDILNEMRQSRGQPV